MPYIGKGANGFGIRERYRYSASGSQTAFTGSDLDSKTLQFDSGSLLDVYLNGVLLDTADYNTNTANTITLTSGATASDEVMIVVYDVFSLSDAMPKTGGTFTGAVTHTGAFTSVGIDDNADATAITINSSEQVGIGTTNPSHDLEIKRTAPEIMLEETSSGGSKRLSLGVTSGGLPFINAEQSGGAIAMNMTGTEVARFNSNGLSFPSGKGLDFSATGDGSGANQNEIFDDYEEGSWTPTLVNGGSGSISVNSSKYTRIGNLVYAGCYINFSNLPNNSTGFQMSGLPFAVIGSSNYHGGGAFTFAGTFNWAGLNAFPAFTPYSGTSQFYLHTSGTTATVTYQMVNSLSALIFSIIYITA